MFLEKKRKETEDQTTLIYKNFMYVHSFPENT